jgi:putative PIN family toxin of toxin-antitoxin system
MALRLVLDTNIWLDWLVFDDAGAAPIKSAVAAARAQIFIDAACERELARVLAHLELDKNPLDSATQATLLEECRRLARMHEHREVNSAPEPLPVCRDTSDQKFLELARDCGADFLVTKDAALLVLARRKIRRAPFQIVTPRQFAAGTE